MILLAYHFKCDTCGKESKENMGPTTHTMSIPMLPIPRGWHYLDHKIVCDGHSVVIDSKWVDAPTVVGASHTGDYPPLLPPNIPGPIRSPIKLPKARKK